jgi:hypothetical protein
LFSAVIHYSTLLERDFRPKNGGFERMATRAEKFGRNLEKLSEPLPAVGFLRQASI